MKVAFIGGSWSSNIGNAFYNLGTFALFEGIPQVECFFVPDPPHWKENVSGDFDLIGHLDVDVVILTGPCLNLKLPDIFAASFKRLRERNVKIGFVSAGMSLYDEGEAAVVRAFLQQHEVSFLFTRDADTFSFYNDKIPCPVYNGLCTSMFLNDAVKVPSLALDPYYVVNFDEKKEPHIELDGATGRYVVTDWKKKSADSINGKRIIRTNNMSITDGYKAIYKRPNVYHSDVPHGYFPILKQAEVVFSERVHTCAATLILGGTAQFIPYASRSFEKRSRLFERIGVGGITEAPQKLNMAYIEEEKNKMRTALEQVLLNLS